MVLIDLNRIKQLMEYVYTSTNNQLQAFGRIQNIGEQVLTRLEALSVSCLK